MGQAFLDGGIKKDYILLTICHDPEEDLLFFYIGEHSPVDK